MKTFARSGCVWLAMTCLLTGVPFSGSVARASDGDADWADDITDGSLLPRFSTPAETEWLKEHDGMGSLRGSTPPPDGPVLCPGEYAPLDGILIAWQGAAQWKVILAQMGAAITTSGNANLHVIPPTSFSVTEATNALSSAGANMSRVIIYPPFFMDSIWMRDYGPRYIYEGGCRAIIDHTYNQPRPNDNAVPAYFAGQIHHAYYEIPLVHGGGNYHLNSLDESNATRLVVNENQNLTEQEIHDLWLAYQNVDTTFWTPFPQTVDATQHIDMWMQVIGDHKIMLSDWPINPGSIQDQICDNAATYFSTHGWTVHRLPAFSVGGTHYTYTNVVMCNSIVLVPTYTNGTVSPSNNTALATWQSALPTYQIVPIPCENIVGAAGVMHCIVMHIPEYLNGNRPSVYLKNLRGGETVDDGEQVEIRWISDDDVATDHVDILLSTNGGLTYGTTIASGTPDDGSYVWTTPAGFTPEAKIKLVIFDGDGFSDEDTSDTSFAIGVFKGDVDQDGDVDSVDYRYFSLCTGDGPLASPTGAVPPMTESSCLQFFDFDEDDNIDLGDFASFAQVYTD